MTRSFNTKLICSHCGSEFTAETALERWIRSRPELDSTESGGAIVRYDCDILLHKYMLDRTRDNQGMMFIEAKTFKAEPTPAQRDTLHLFNQVLRGKQCAYSVIAQKEITVHLFGGHLLQLSGDSPETSNSIIWHKKHEIDVPTLIQILRFELDPDTLKPLRFEK